MIRNVQTKAIAYERIIRVTKFGEEKFTFYILG